MNDKRCMYCHTKIDGNRLFCCDRHRYKYYHNSDLVLTLKKKWFDMIYSGIKTEEYREMKSYWEKRFLNYFGKHYDDSGNLVWNIQAKRIIFRNGYGNDKPEFHAICSIREGYGKEEWGAEKDCKYYVLAILKIIAVKNMDNCKREE